MTGETNTHQSAWAREKNTHTPPHNHTHNEEGIKEIVRHRQLERKLQVMA